jgi:hypothetical protein
MPVEQRAAGRWRGKSHEPRKKPDAEHGTEKLKMIWRFIEKRGAYSSRNIHQNNQCCDFSRDLFEKLASHYGIVWRTSNM